MSLALHELAYYFLSLLNKISYELALKRPLELPWHIFSLRQPFEVLLKRYFPKMISRDPEATHFVQQGHLLQ